VPSVTPVAQDHHVVSPCLTLIADYQRGGIVPSANDAFNFSMWRGYLSKPDVAEVWSLP